MLIVRPRASLQHVDQLRIPFARTSCAVDLQHVRLAAPQRLRAIAPRPPGFPGRRIDNRNRRSRERAKVDGLRRIGLPAVPTQPIPVLALERIAQRARQLGSVYEAIATKRRSVVIGETAGGEPGNEARHPGRGRSRSRAREVEALRRLRNNPRILHRIDRP
jgi:hypothetical protein